MDTVRDDLDRFRVALAKAALDQPR